MRLLALLFFVLPLTGCLLPPEEAPLQAGEAVYEGGDWTLHLRLTGPVRALMGDGSYQDANLLEAWTEGSADGVTSMALDGDLRSLWRYDECLWHSTVCESPAQVDWTAHGRLGLYGVGWMHTGLWQRVEYEDVAAPVVRDGDALVVRDDPDAPRAGAWGLIEGRYEYADGGLFPTRMVLGETAYERVSWTPSGPLAAVPAEDPGVPQTGADGFFPGTDEAVFAGGSLDSFFRALRTDEEASAALDAGCIQRVEYPLRSPPSEPGLLQTRESESFTFGIGGPEPGAWRVTRSWGGVQPEEYEVSRTAPGGRLGACQARPLAQVSAQAFLAAASPFATVEPHSASLSFHVGGGWWSRELHSVPVAWKHWERSDDGTVVELEMDAHTGAWRVWRVPVAEVEAAGLVQAAMAAVDSSSRNQ